LKGRGFQPRRKNPQESITALAARGIPRWLILSISLL
jgi:hypothetical protein